MNRFITLATLALACLAMASAQPIGPETDVESQSMLEPTNEEETANLVGQTLVFSDYCLETRDAILGDIRRRDDQLSKIIASYFQKFNDETSALAEGKKDENKQTSGAMGYGETILALWNGIQDACPQIKSYERDIEKRFSEAKSKLDANDIDLQSINIRNVNCITSKRVLRMAGVCNLLHRLWVI